MSRLAILAAAVLCGLSLYRGFQGETFMGRAMGGDFVQFYVIGKILNEYEPARIYDLDLEVRLQHECLPGMSKTQMLVFGHAPYVGLLYRPFALLPYGWAYVAWLVFSLALYMAGLLLLVNAAQLSAEQKKTGFLLGMGSMAYLLETWIGGQLSVVGFFLFAVFVHCRSRRRMFLDGAALALAAYKPTLIALPVLMLLCGRRWRTLCGMAAGVAAAIALSIATAGVKGCVAWVDSLRFFRGLVSSPLATIRRAKYVDLGSFFSLLLPGAPLTVQVLAGVTGVAAIVTLAWAWRRSSSWSSASVDLLWAATLTGVLVLNVYTPIYDTIVAGAAVALVAGAMRECRSEEREAFSVWLLLLYLVPWLTQSSAEFLRFQPLTLVLAGFAGWALALAWRVPGIQGDQKGCGG